MLKALLLLLMNLALAGMATAQNLVPNPSFEDTVNCETPLQCDLLRATGWYNPNTATPDVYDCDLDRNCGQPMDMQSAGIQAKGYQYAHEGTRHAGGFQWYGAGSSYTRDYLMTELQEELEADAAYEVGLYCSRAEGYAYATDRISAYLGPMAVFEDHPNYLSTVVPQVQLMLPDSGYLTEGTEWVHLVDTVWALGGERWLVIGTFLGPNEVNGIVASPGSVYNYAYYYFDEVSVRRVEVVNAITDRGFNLSWTMDGLVVTPSMVGSVLRLNIFDPAGRSVGTWNGQVSGRTLIPMPELASGAYIAVVESDRVRQAARFVRVE